METFAIFARVEAKAGKEKEVLEFLKSALPLAKGEPGTIRWYALQFGPSTFGIFDTFETEQGREAHLNGPIAAALMKNAVMNYTNDSAPLHFASAMDAPVTAIFCSTVPSFGFYPLSSRSFVAETKEKLECRPCSLHGLRACPLGHFKCARTIETAQLLLTLSL